MEVNSDYHYQFMVPPQSDQYHPSAMNYYPQVCYPVEATSTMPPMLMHQPYCIHYGYQLDSSFQHPGALSQEVGQQQEFVEWNPQLEQPIMSSSAPQFPPPAYLGMASTTWQQQQQPLFYFDTNGIPIIPVNIPTLMPTGETTLVSVPVPASEFALLPYYLQEFHLQQQFQMDEPVDRDSIRSGSRGRRSSSRPKTSNSGSGLNNSGSTDHLIGYCRLCQSNGETVMFVKSHVLQDANGIVRCPVLRKYVCKVCKASGDNAHTLRYCPVMKQRKQEMEQQKKDAGEYHDDDEEPERYVEKRNAVGGFVQQKY